MNYIKGKSLEERIAHKRPLDFETAIKISENILSALEALHQQKVIHRDIKPGNIMIEGKSGKAVLIDFGLAKDKLKETTLTSSGVYMGTPAYMSPEQFKKPKELDSTTDIYSFGGVLFEMITGETPFRGSEFVEIMEEHCEKAVPNVREKNHELPPGIENVIFKAMAKKPGDRYQSARKFLNALKAVEATPKEIDEKKTVEKESIRRHPIKEAPIEEFKVHHKRYETRKPLFNLLVIIAALLAILIGVFIVINPLKGPGKEQLEQYRKHIKKENPFGEKINKKTRQIYKNSKGFWEADYGDGIVMVYIPPGEFAMGSNDYDDEKPPHSVYLDGYWMGKHEVTFAQYDKYCEETQKKKPDDRGCGRGNRPVIYVSWNEASAYCDWLSNRTGLSFKLPTEAQWEKAARGIDGHKYPWGNHGPYYNGKYYANYDPGKYEEDGFKSTAPVGSFPQGASPYGLLDMAGNVWEWCGDWYDKNYYKNSPKNNPTGPESGSVRVVRGGGWSSYAGNLRCAVRGNGRPSERVNDLGFRLCQDNK
jgi:serine/threonine-protein kinase